MRTLSYFYICHRTPAANAHGLGFKTSSATKDLMNFDFEPSIPLHWRTLNDQRSMVMSRFRNISESLAFYGWWDCTAGVQGMLTYILFSAGLFISTARGYLLFLAYKLIISRAKSCELDVTCLTSNHVTLFVTMTTHVTLPVTMCPKFYPVKSFQCHMKRPSLSTVQPWNLKTDRFPGP